MGWLFQWILDVLVSGLLESLLAGLFGIGA